LAVKIRLARHGAKKKPFYWVVVADSRSPRDGAFIEKIGTYNPFLQGSDKAKVNVERAEYWLATGAQPTDRVAKLLDLLAIRKKSQRFNPLKGKPKTKSQERMKIRSEMKTTVLASELDDIEMLKAQNQIRELTGSS
jgi:small subunit ribosomal protein S16